MSGGSLAPRPVGSGPWEDTHRLPSPPQVRTPDSPDLASEHGAGSGYCTWLQLRGDRCRATDRLLMIGWTLPVLWAPLAVSTDLTDACLTCHQHMQKKRKKCKQTQSGESSSEIWLVSELGLLASWVIFLKEL